MWPLGLEDRVVALTQALTLHAIPALGSAFVALEESLVDAGKAT